MGNSFTVEPRLELNQEAFYPVTPTLERAGVSQSSPDPLFTNMIRVIRQLFKRGKHILLAISTQSNFPELDCVAFIMYFV